MSDLPAGFSFGAARAGLKAGGGPDVGVLVSGVPAAAAAVLTTNRVQAAPIRVTREHLAGGVARAIVVNSGNANACTGASGLADARAMASRTAERLGVLPEQVLVASTGVIGVPMDMSKVANGIDGSLGALGPDPDGFAEAILTTDTQTKIATADAGGARVWGVAKGAGMIAPEMATMLAFVATDAVVDVAAFGAALRDAAGRSFNAISVDGCRSTNDCVIALANGEARIAPSGEELRDALVSVCSSLARKIVEDGEGATKVVEVTVAGAVDDEQARAAASAICDSVLFRCAVHGADPNWGRVLAALGASSAWFDPDDVDVWLAGEQVCAAGTRGPGDLAATARAMQERHVQVLVDLHAGEGRATRWTNDLSAAYVAINAEYTT